MMRRAGWCSCGSSPPESAFDYFRTSRAYLEEHGKPVALYSDKHGIYCRELQLSRWSRWFHCFPYIRWSTGPGELHRAERLGAGRQYGGLAHAAVMLDYSSVGDLQNAMATYCGG
jgi:hypothetical protein